MKLVIQRVKNAKVVVEEKTIGEIEKGFMVLLGVAPTDTKEIADFLVQKLIKLRVFEDENEKMNLSLQDINGELLIVIMEIDQVLQKLQPLKWQMNYMNTL